MSRPRSPKTPHNPSPRVRLNLEALEDRRVPAVNFAALASQLDTYLASVETELHTHFDTAVPLPGVGKTISQLTTVDDHVTELRGDLNAVLTKPGGYTNDGELTTALNTALAGWTDKVFTVSPFDANSTGLTLTLVDVSRDAASGPTETATLQTGLPGLPLWMNAPPAVEVRTGAAFENLTVTINGNSVSINSAQSPATFKVSVLGGLAADATFEGVVGMLPVTGEDNGTALNFTVSMGLADLGQTIDVLAPTLSGSADIDLKLTGGFTQDPAAITFPTLRTDLGIYWGFGGGPADLKLNQIARFGSAPSVTFSNVQLNLGSVVGSLAGPLANNLEKLVEPLANALEQLDEDLPVLDELGEHVSILDIIGDDSGLGGVAHLPAQLAGLIDDLEVLTQDPAKMAELNQAFVNLGSFDLGNSGDLRTLPPVDFDKLADEILPSLADLLPDVIDAATFDDILDQLDDPLLNLSVSTQAEVSALFGLITGSVSLEAGLVLESPLLQDPAGSVFQLLLGNDVDLLSLTVTAAGDGEFDVFLPLPLPIPGSVKISGMFAGAAEVRAAYDTFGLRKYALGIIENAGPDLSLLTHGFYIDTDSSVAVAGFLQGSLSVDLIPGLLDAGVSGFIIADVGITTHDEPGSTDGKARLFAEPLKPLFTLDGSVFGSLDFFFEVGPWPWEVVTNIHLGGGTILQLGYNVNNPFSPPADLALADAATAANSIGSDHYLVPGGVLTLNVGALAVNRDVEELEINEVFTVSPVDPGVVKVTAFGYSQFFHGVTEINAAAGTGNDFITVLEGVTAKVTLDGGAGDDQLVNDGSGVSVLVGGAGADFLIGGTGANQLKGDAGNDHLTSRAGAGFASLLEGGADNDILEGGAGHNDIYGGTGNDKLYAGDAGDYLDGGDHDDGLYAGAGNDVLLGGTGNDTVTWVAPAAGSPPVAVTADGGTGTDTLLVFGTAGIDTFALNKFGPGFRLSVNGSTLDGTSFLRAEIDALAGADQVTVNYFESTGLEDVNVNLGETIATDGAEDTVVVNARAVADEVVVETEAVGIQKISGGGHDPDYVMGGVTKFTLNTRFRVRVGNVDDDVTLNALGGNDLVEVRGVSGPTLLNAGTANDTFKLVSLPPVAPGVPSYVGPLKLEAGAGVNALAVDETQAETADVLLLGTANVSSSRFGSVDFVATGGNYGGGVTVTATPFGDQLRVAATLPGVATTVNAFGGNDSIVVSSNADPKLGTLSAIQGPLTIDGGAGGNTLTLGDGGAAGGNGAVTVNATHVVGFAGPGDNIPVAYKATGGTFAALVLEGAGGPESFALAGPTAPVVIRGNGGNDYFRAAAVTQTAVFEGGVGDDTAEVVDANGKLDQILAAVQLAGGAGYDKLYVSDGGAAAGQSYTLAPSSVQRSGTGAVGFTAVEDVWLTTSGFDDQLNVSGVPVGAALTVYAGTGSDTLTGPTAANTWLLTQTDGGALNGTLRYSAVENLTGGAGADRFRFAPGGAVSGTVTGGASDVLDYTSYAVPVTVNVATKTATAVNAFAGSVKFEGGSAADTVIGPDTANTWQVGTPSVTLFSPVGLHTFTGFENLQGGSQSDQFVFAPGAALGGWLDGKAGTNLLSYSGWTTGVTVDLSTGSATGVQGQVVAIQNLTGGTGDDRLTGNNEDNLIRGGGGVDVILGLAGNDILLGEDGADTLDGGSGRDLLIGGLGSDDLFGGVDEDILVGGQTGSDNNNAELAAIMATWAGPGAYSVRVAALINSPLFVWFNDGALDRLTGGAGLDWFWGAMDWNDATTVNNVPEVVS